MKYDKLFVMKYDKPFVMRYNKLFVIKYDRPFVINIINLLSWFLMIQNFQQTIFQYVIDEFASFLRR